VNCVNVGDSLFTTLLALFGSHLEDLGPRILLDDGQKEFFCWLKLCVIKLEEMDEDVLISYRGYKAYLK